MSTLPAPPATHPAATTGHIPADSIGPLPPHLSDIGSPARQNSSYSGSPYRGASPHSTSYIPSGSPVGYAAPAATYQSGSPGRYSAAPASAYQPAGSPIGATGPTYEQEVQSFLDQSSPQRVREQSPTVLPSADYMAKAEHEAATNENSPARQRSYGGSHAGSPSGYVPSSPPTYAAPVTTSYAAPAPTSYAAPVSSYVAPVSGSPGRYSAAPVSTYQPAGSPIGATGPTYEQEVQSFLDQSSPQRVREQSPTVLPSADYMAKAEHEAATNENSPARQRSYAGSPSGYVPSSPPPTYAAPVTTSYAAPAPTSYAAPVSSYHQPPASYVQPSSVVHASTEHIPLVAGSPGHHAATPVPEYPAAGDLHGESPRRVRAFGASHTDPHAPGNEYSPQRVR